ncbi:MAG: hydroxymethylbilane synthase [Gemmatimonadota bacterium]
MSGVIRIGARGSALALWQAEHIKARLMAAHAGLDVEIEIIRTTGDRITDVPLSKIGDKGLFTKELDQAVRSGRVHIAVHSLKDIPTRVEPGLLIAAVSKRDDPSDALVVAPRRARSLAALPAGSRVGTSSLRRRAQLLALRPDILVAELRGNVDTRLASVREEKYDATILALAGMNRLGRASEAAEILDAQSWLPAVGQGALGIVAREADGETRARLSILDDYDTRVATAAERALLRELEGGCQIPIGALALVSGDNLTLRALVATIDGTRVVRGERAASRSRAEDLGRELAHDLLDRGAGDILAQLRNWRPDEIPQPAAP